MHFGQDWFKFSSIKPILATSYKVGSIAFSGLSLILFGGLINTQAFNILYKRLQEEKKHMFLQGKILYFTFKNISDSFTAAEI